jgi:hypothetical protein
VDAHTTSEKRNNDDDITAEGQVVWPPDIVSMV